MIHALKKIYADFRGFDETGSAVPMMDGPLKPNMALDAAPVALHLPDVDNLLATGDGLICSHGGDVMRLAVDGASPALTMTHLRSFSADVTCLASDGAQGLAIGVDGQGIVVEGGRHDGRQISTPNGELLRAPTAALFLDPDTLVVAVGSADNLVVDWKRDLMTRGSSGSIWRLSLAAKDQQAVPLTRNLAFPYGLASAPDGSLVVTEAWRHRVIAIDPGSAKPSRVLLADLPAYPARIVPADDGYWLALFAPRNQLVEFVLSEDAYRRRMVADIDPAYWIAPALATGASFLEPIQGGARKKLNMLKPWSPSWSYGLVVRCDRLMRPLTSFHSRADGRIHGVTSLAEQGGSLFVGAKGSGVVVALDTRLEILGQ
nr:hypothetical protein [uncultured Dongia sp.]